MQLGRAGPERLSQRWLIRVDGRCSTKFLKDLALHFVGEGAMIGWAETTIVIRFWLICGLCIALGLGIFYAEWLTT